MVWGRSGCSGFTGFGVFQLLAVLCPSPDGRKRPILLKKSTLVSTAEKYASEIEILTFD